MQHDYCRELAVRLLRLSLDLPRWEASLEQGVDPPLPDPMDSLLTRLNGPLNSPPPSPPPPLDLEVSLQTVKARVEMVKKERGDLHPHPHPHPHQQQQQQPVLRRVEALMAKSMALTSLPKKLDVYATSVHAIMGVTADEAELTTLFGLSIFYLPGARDLDTTDLFRRLLRTRVSEPELNTDWATATVIRKKRAFLNVVKKCTVMPASLWQHLKDLEKQAANGPRKREPAGANVSLHTFPMHYSLEEGPDQAENTLETIMVNFRTGRKYRKTEMRIATTVFKTPTALTTSVAAGDEDSGMETDQAVTGETEGTAGTETDRAVLGETEDASGTKTGETAGGKETDQRASGRGMDEGASGKERYEHTTWEKTDTDASGELTDARASGKETDTHASGEETDTGASGEEADEPTPGKPTPGTATGEPTAPGMWTDDSNSSSEEFPDLQEDSMHLDDMYKYCFVLKEPENVEVMYVCSQLSFLPLLPDLRIYAYKTPNFVDVWRGSGRVVRFVTVDMD